MTLSVYFSGKLIKIFFLSFCKVVTVGGFSAYQWNNPVIEKQHGFYPKSGDAAPLNQVKGTPSFDWLKVELNDKSPLIGTKWARGGRTRVVFAYPPGARKYNLEIRKRKVAERRKEEITWKIQQISNKMAKRSKRPQFGAVYQVEAYEDTASSSSSSDHDQVFSSEDAATSPDEEGDDWTPDGGRWMKELPEYQYDGLRGGSRSRLKMAYSHCPRLL